jgi:hypothetical protein
VIRQNSVRGQQRELITLGAKPADHTDGHVREVRAVPKVFPREDIGYMDLDERDAHTQQSVPQGNTAVGQGARIENDEGHSFVRRVMNPVNEFMLRIALKEGHLIPPQIPEQRLAVGANVV